MSKVSEFIKDFSIISFGNILSKIFAALIAIVIARSLSPGNFGKFSIAFSIMTIIAAGLTGIDYTYVHNHIGKFGRIKLIFSEYVFFKFLITLFLVTVGILFSKQLSRYVFHNEISVLGLNLALFTAISFIAYRLVYTFYQANEDFTKVAFAQVIFYLLVFLGVLLFIYLKIKTYFLLLLPYLVVGFLIFTLFLIYKNEEFRFKRIPFFTFFRYGRWIILSEIFIVLLARLDFLILSHHFSGSTLGYYSVAVRIINIYLTFTAAFSAIMLPKASGIINEQQKRQFYKASSLLFLILIILNISLIFSSRIIINVLFGAQYSQSLRYVQFLLLAYIPFTLYQPFRYLTYTFNKTLFLFLVPFIQCILLFIIGPLFIKELSAYGIIIAKAAVFIIGLSIFIGATIKEKFHNGK